MERPDLPSAADLGVTEIEYERILRGLRQRERSAGPRTNVPDDARDLVEVGGTVEYVGASSPSGATAADRPVRKIGRTSWVWLVIAAVAGAAFFAPAAKDDEPGPEYKFFDTVDGRPVAHSSCRPLPVAIYPAGGPADGESVVREAIGILRAATGLDIVVTGVFGGHAPGWNFEAAPRLPDDPVGVSWQNSSAIAELKGETIGIGGSHSETSPTGTTYLVAGTVALDREYFARAGRPEQVAVVLHEFGHVLGLAHVKSREELMYPTTGNLKLGKGDLEGLRLAGKGPCV